MIPEKNMMEDEMLDGHPPRRFVDRTVPIGLIVAIMVQIAAGVWYASAQAATIRQTSIIVSEQGLRLERLESRMAAIEPALAVLKDRSDDNLDTSRRIEGYLRGESSQLVHRH